jgi:hypothetical protein
MQPRTASGLRATALTRIGRPAATSVEELGPLGDLVGTWVGAQGWELIAVPNADSFKLIVRPYVETLTFSPIGAPVPDRGGRAGDLMITGLLYETRINALDKPPGVLHIENGMWLYLGPDIARLATIPHGDVLLALGTGSTSEGRPDIPKLDARPPNLGPQRPPLGYLDQYGEVVAPPNVQNVNEVLTVATADQNITRTTTLDVSTANGGGMLNIPFVSQNANATKFACTFWIETVTDPKTGQQVQQLQYSQQTDIRFLLQFGDPDQLITWPHVNVNTLHKQ